MKIKTPPILKVKYPLPDFLGIGAQKAGTTWLHDNLSCHPELYLPPEKEIHYFDQHNDKPISYYSQFFKKSKKNRACVKGEITPAYSVLPQNMIERIMGIMPHLKIIFVHINFSIADDYLSLLKIIIKIRLIKPRT